MHITDNESLHNFFSFVSKAVLIIPIFIVIVSLFFKFNQPKQGLDLPAGRQVNQIPTIIPIISITKTGSIKFDLKGPIVCENLFIQDKKILLKNKSINYLLNGDCLYSWETNKLVGNKKCGLSSYISLAETYSEFMSVEDLINNDLIKDKIKNKDLDLTSIIKSCKREEIKDKTIFGIPKQVSFEVK